MERGLAVRKFKCSTCATGQDVDGNQDKARERRKDNMDTKQLTRMVWRSASLIHLKTTSILTETSRQDRAGAGGPEGVGKAHRTIFPWPRIGFECPYRRIQSRMLEAAGNGLFPVISPSGTFHQENNCNMLSASSQDGLVSFHIFCPCKCCPISQRQQR